MDTGPRSVYPDPQYVLYNIINHHQSTKYPIGNPKYFIGSSQEHKRTKKTKNYIFSNDFQITLSSATTLRSSKSESERKVFTMFLRLRSFLNTSSKLRHGLPLVPTLLAIVKEYIQGIFTWNITRNSIRNFTRIIFQGILRGVFSRNSIRNIFNDCICGIVSRNIFRECFQ